MSKKCELTFCIATKKTKQRLIMVNENIGDASFATYICSECAEALGLKKNDDMPDGNKVNPILKRILKQRHAGIVRVIMIVNHTDNAERFFTHFDIKGKKRDSIKVVTSEASIVGIGQKHPYYIHTFPVSLDKMIAMLKRRKCDEISCGDFMRLVGKKNLTRIK